MFIVWTRFGKYSGVVVLSRLNAGERRDGARRTSVRLVTKAQR
jgi:hypothetical protein